MTHTRQAVELARQSPGLALVSAVGLSRLRDAVSI